ncbi:MAG: hypothetical protein IJ583_16150 [Firmicutes bacterium]|nr:hypothetical protein [Bacillota bacterium]
MDYNTENGNLDQIIKNLYNKNKGYVTGNVNVSDNSIGTEGVSDSYIQFTIPSGYTGKFTASGRYTAYTNSYSDSYAFDYSLAVTVSPNANANFYSFLNHINCDDWHVLYENYWLTELAQYSGYSVVAYSEGQINAGFQFAVLYEGASAPAVFIDYIKHNLYGTQPSKIEDVEGTNGHIAYYDSATILAEYNEYLTGHSESFNPAHLTIQAKADGTTLIYGIYAIPPANWVNLFYSKNGEQYAEYSGMNIACDALYLNSDYDLAVIYSASADPTLWLDWQHTANSGTANYKKRGKYCVLQRQNIA